MKKKRTESQLAIVSLRQAAKFTQMDLAVYMGRTQTTVGRWETMRPPSGSSLFELRNTANELGQFDLAKVFQAELDRDREYRRKRKGWSASHMVVERGV